MDSKQIAGPFCGEAGWLKEIAYQLAVMNKRAAEAPETAALQAYIQSAIDAQAETNKQLDAPKVCHHHRIFPDCNICEPAPRRSRGYDPCCSTCKILGVACAGHRA